MLSIWIKTTESLTCPTESLPGLAPACLSRPVSDHARPCSLQDCLHFLRLSTPPPGVGPLHAPHTPSARSTFPSPESAPECSHLSSLMLPQGSLPSLISQPGFVAQCPYCQCCDFVFVMSFGEWPPSLEDCKSWVGRAFGWVATQHLAKCLAQSRPSINICWINGWG